MSKQEWRAASENGESWYVFGEDGWTIAEDLNEPTARLIAAAPDMAEALKDHWRNMKAFPSPLAEAALKKAGITT